MNYLLSHFSYQRIPSIEVKIGDLLMGGNHPIRIQSMTTTDTMDTQKTVEQSLRMVEAGCELVRITAPSIKEAENLANIKKELRARGCSVPLVADIHFTPNAAEVAARIVEKVRVNPGNYADKKKFEEIEYSDASYQAELDRIYKKFSPLVKICKEYGTAMRIGTNHGSLSDRIMSRYGDSPLGMVESAWEFLQICEDFNYHNLVISMKASNPQVMVQAYRLLMERMLKHGRVYPLHLGVTEAGEGEDGRVKSALGIATLLMDGIGDTVRVSLTEEPEYEMPVAKFLVDYYVKQANLLRMGQDTNEKLPFSPYAFERRKSETCANIGGLEVPRVIGDIRAKSKKVEDLKEMGWHYLPALDKYNASDIAADFVYLGNNVPDFELPGGLKAIYNAETWATFDKEKQATTFPYFSAPNTIKIPKYQAVFIRIAEDNLIYFIQNAAHFKNAVLVLDSDEVIPTYHYRKMIYTLTNAGIKAPMLVMLREHHNLPYSDTHLPETLQLTNEAKAQLSLSSDLSTLLVDGLIDGVFMEKATSLMMKTVFGCLQMSRMRITKTEYISCPSCGRTLFDLQETTARIRAKTEHLKGVKIGIMGCIVNGPGEMADADYGYVGVGVDKISLYRGKEVVMKNVKTAEAVDKLIDLIKEDSRWVEM
ncbi:MAG: (E)-4-hydroxy-3-methylbut-2-enyl-diphosphate synthase [Bacteroidia bacterium]